MTKRSKTTKPTLTEEEWDFRFGPVRLRTNRPLASIAEHWAETEAVLRDCLLDSLQDKCLPESVVLAQFISVPPQHGKAPINLRVPAVVRSSDPQWKAFVQGFAYTAHFAQTAGGFSFHNRATEDLKTPSGTIVVFTTEQTAPKEHPFDGVNVIWVQMKDVTPASVPHIAEIEFVKALLPEEAAPFRLLHVGDILELESNRKVFSRQISGTHNASVSVYPKIGLNGQEEKLLRDFIVNTLGTDAGSVAFNPYLKHVANSVSCGPVILALPKKVYFNDQTQNALVDNSGLSTLFRSGTTVTYAEMQDSFRIAHRLSTAFAHLYGIAQVIGEAERSTGAVNAYRMVAHSLGNAIERLPPGNLFVERCLRLEQLAIEAAALLHGPSTHQHRKTAPIWSAAGACYETNSEPLETTVAGATFPNDTRYTIECSCLHALKPDPRFVALLTELARNMEEHSKSDTGSIRVTPSRRHGLFDVSISSDCDYTLDDSLRRLLQKCRSSGDRNAGSEFVLLLAQSLAGQQASISYVIGSSIAGTGVVVSDECDTISRLSLSLYHDPSIARALHAAKKEQDESVRFPFCIEITNIHAGTP